MAINKPMNYFDNSYACLPGRFFQKIPPSAGERPSLAAFNQELAQEIGLQVDRTDTAELARIFSGKKLLEGSDPLAMPYCGHQFGHFNPFLGDGRAHLLGEIVNERGKRFDIQLKGSGRTKYSRSGDGRSWIGPVIREYVVSEAMHALGVPTTRALAAVRSGEEVLREETLPGGILARVASSHLRIGTVEYFRIHGQQGDLQTIVDYAIKRHYPHITAHNNKYLMFFRSVAEAKLSLVAKWMGLGFIHGVMNTDNTSLAGITIDYGPCAFMDNFSHKKVFSSIDRYGRYAYGNQGDVALWNLSVLANAMFPLLKDESEKNETETIRILEGEFEKLKTFYDKAWLKTMASKLGIFNPAARDKNLVNQYLDYLEKENLDFTNSFRDLNTFKCSPNKSFEQGWLERISEQGKERPEVKTLMDKSNPYIIPRNHQVALAIEKALDEDDGHFQFLISSCKLPYDEDKRLKELTRPPMPEEVVHQTFCGT